jgi:hypothetical protein
MVSPVNTHSITSVVDRLTLDQLLGLAISRGCQHYTALASARHFIESTDTLRHEALGCALLRGPEDLTTFQSIRVGSMVLSDTGNSPILIAEFAHLLEVSARVAHIARLGLEFDSFPTYWQSVLDHLRHGVNTGNGVFLPGPSRLYSESPLTGHGRERSRVWLRTAYHNIQTKESHARSNCPPTRNGKT